MLLLMMLICEVEYNCRQHLRHDTIHCCYLRWKHDDVCLLTKTLNACGYSTLLMWEMFPPVVTVARKIHSSLTHVSKK